MTDSNLGTQLIDSIPIKDIGDLGIDISEALLDTFITDTGLLNNIPIIGGITGLVKIGISVKEIIYIKKLMKFLNEIYQVSEQERQAFADKLREPEQKKKLGETIILLLERADSLEKVKLIGRIWKNNIQGNLTREDTLKLSYIINNVYITDLNYLVNFTGGIQKDQAKADHLFSCGLLSWSGIDGGEWGDNESGGMLYVINKYGKLIVKFALED